MKIFREGQRFTVVAILLLWCTALIPYRMYLASDLLAMGLLWNLFLAVVPLFRSSALETASTRKHPVVAAVCFVLWLLFLPNAPYILTDLIHLAPRPHVPVWYLLAMLLSCAGTGTLLGYFSLITVHRIVERSFGQTMGWVLTAGSLMGCGFGIYMGRFLRWNSWDALTHPLQFLKTIIGQFIDSVPHPHPLAVTLVFGTGLVVGYVALHMMATYMMATSLSPTRERDMPNAAHP